ncbi:glycosyltransferase family 4 protein, partial [bacterium]|nr:glycosyltransferase family 4 protein [bacterium]
MKIAIVNQYSSAGGGARFIRALGKALADKYPEDDIGFFTDALNLERDSFEDLFRMNKNLSVYSLNRIDGQSQVKDVNKKDVDKVSFKRCVKDRLKKIRLIVSIYNFIKFKILRVEDKWYLFSFEEETIKKLEEFDVIYLSWPYFLEPYRFGKPIVGTFHDFNYKHSFGNFAPELLSTIERQMPQWINMAKKAIVSTEFIEKEIWHFYPESKGKTKVVFLTSNSITRENNGNLKCVMEKYKLPDNYILSPSNTSKHKNLLALLNAFGILKEKKIDVKLVLTGFGTENLAFLKPGLKTKEDTFSEKIFADYQKVIDKYDIKVG